jgi:hypothetical protein
MFELKPISEIQIKDQALGGAWNISPGELANYRKVAEVQRVDDQKELKRLNDVLADTLTELRQLQAEKIRNHEAVVEPPSYIAPNERPKKAKR